MVDKETFHFSPLGSQQCEPIKRALANNELVVLTAPPGTGKTTRIPLALLHEPWLTGKKIIVLEPRRLAARRAALYMAELLNESVGEAIGFQVRLERCIGPKTRIEFLTEGLLTQRLLEDPELEDVGCILFDEFHERSLMLDLGFALAREVREALRPDLRLMLMSATIPDKLLPDATFISIPAKAYPVEVKHLGAISVEAAISQALRETSGSILCFLPGEGEIKRAAETIHTSSLPKDVTVAPLYAALPKKEQDTAVAPPHAGERKIVLATSIAESALTIEGITVVIDTGLARVPRYSSKSGLSRLELRRISLDRVTQRTGRAGRLAPGVCYRLWDAREELTFVKTASPEINDTDLTQSLLLCAAWGSLDIPWLTPPPPGAKKRALETLITLGALDTQCRITSLGKAMVRFPVHPSLAAMMLKMEHRDKCGAALMAAICAEGEKFATLRKHYDFRSIMEWVLQERPYEIWQLASRWAKHKQPLPKLPLDELLPTLLLAYPHQIARRRDNASGRYLTAAGFGFTLPEEAKGRFGEWMLALRLSEQDGDAQLRWGLALSENDLTTCNREMRIRVEWDKTAGRVIAEEIEAIGAIILKRRPLKVIPQEARIEVERCRLQHIGLPWDKHTSSLVHRIAFLRNALPEEQWPLCEETQLIDLLATGEAPTLERAIIHLLNASGHSLYELDVEAPLRYKIPSGSDMHIHYDGAQPYVAVKIQEVFGLPSTPRLAKGRIPLLLHLLSPAQRPVQVTSDLANFWANGYAIVRKDLRGRYPKHNWPENPTLSDASRRTTKPKAK